MASQMDRLSELNNEIPQVFERVIEKAQIGDISEILKTLLKVTNETERNIYIEQLAKKLKIGKRAILNDLKKIERSAKTELNYIANFSGLIDLVQDEEGNVAFLIKGEDGLSISKKYEGAGGVEYYPPVNLPFSLPKGEDVFYWYEFDGKLFDDVVNYFQCFSHLPEKLWQIVAFTVFLSYIHDHPDIHYLPILLFYAVPERGKTRTGKAFIYLAHRGIHNVDLREANLFRYSQDLQATLFLDIRDLWKKAERNGTEDILLLRYEKGAKVSRVLYPEKGAFKDMVHYAIYGPTVIATNEALHRILDTRCIPIIMPNKPGNYENPTPDKAQELKERLTAWRARVIDTPLPEIEIIPGLNGRLWDISRPLLQVCKIVYPQGFEYLKETLLEIAGQRIEDKKDSTEGQIISAIYDLSPNSIPDWTVKTQDVLDAINKKRPENYKLSPQYLGKKLSAIGIKTRKVHGYSEIILKKADFDTYLLQYGIIDEPSPVETLPNSTILPNQDISTVCTGRKLVESKGNSTQTLPMESLDNQVFEGLVESGRELQSAGKKKYLKSLEVAE